MNGVASTLGSFRGDDTRMNGVLEGVASNAIWACIPAIARKMLGYEIKITNPSPGQTLSAPEPLGSSFSYSVQGSLKRLPKDHQIWLLSEPEPSGKIWPQSFFSAQYNRHQGTWLGKISGARKGPVRITAVVAPPTSQDFFRYFQRVGELRGYQFEPITRIPPECVIRDFVQALFP